MKQEDKDLLLKDLGARLPYGVKCSFGVDDAIYEICGINPVCCGASEIQATHVESGINGDFTLGSCKSYLFPLSSMTEEQRKEYRQFLEDIDGYDPFICIGCNKYKQCIPYEGNEHLIDKADDCDDFYKTWE